MARAKYTLVLKDAFMIAPQVRHLVFMREDGQSASFIPGQFVNFHFEVDGKPKQRSYSIATIPGKSDSIEITIAYVDDGQATNLLSHLQKGEKIECSGPFGRLILKDERPKRFLLIATGTGVAPYRTMLPEISARLNQQPTLEVHLVLGVRRPEELLFGGDFIQFAKDHKRFFFYACYSREQPDTPEPYEHAGRVHPLIEQLKPNPEHDIVYLCGNPAMIDDAFNALKERGFDNRTVRREKYVFSH